MNVPDDERWVKAAEAKQFLSVRACELMHLREAGKLRFRKKRNAYLYLMRDLKNEAALRKLTPKN